MFMIIENNEYLKCEKNEMYREVLYVIIYKQNFKFLVLQKLRVDFLLIDIRE